MKMSFVLNFEVAFETLESGTAPLAWCVSSPGPMSASPVKGDTVMVAGPRRGRLSL